MSQPNGDHEQEQLEHDGIALGFDVSTQSCKIVAVRVKDLSIVATSRVHYDTDMPQFSTVDGVHRYEVNLRKATTPTLLWLSAMIECMKRICAALQQIGISPSAIKVISGSGQQHGTVYWALPDPNSSSFDVGAVNASYFAVGESPIWMDSSPIDACEALEEKLGGAERVRTITGSRCVPRFSIHHIAQLRREDASKYDKTTRVSLVSSFGASVLIGRIAPIDTTDAAGMNAMDIRSLTWSKDILDAVDVDAKLLGPLVSPWDVVGTVAPFWCTKEFGLDPQAAVVAWSGDNPCAVVGMGLVQPGDILISLGTSDTCIFVASTNDLKPGSGASFGHVFPHPVARDACFGMLVYANGDITRRLVRDEYASGSWDVFDRLIRDPLFDAPNGAPFVGIRMTCAEISPPLPLNAQSAAARFEGGQHVAEFSVPNAMNCRAVIEYRALAIRRHLREMCPDLFGPNMTNRRLLMTGGATTSSAIVQLYADVFGLPVACLSIPEAAAYGAAIRAVHGISFSNPSVNPATLLAKLGAGEVVATPSASSCSDEAREYFEAAGAAASLLEDELR